MGDRADSWSMPMLILKIGEEKIKDRRRKIVPEITSFSSN